MTSSISAFTSPNKLRLYFLAFTAFSILLFPIPWHIGAVSHPLRAWAGRSSAIWSLSFLTVAVTSMNALLYLPVWISVSLEYSEIQLGSDIAAGCKHLCHLPQPLHACSLPLPHLCHYDGICFLMSCLDILSSNSNPTWSNLNWCRLLTNYDKSA